MAKNKSGPRPEGATDKRRRWTREKKLEIVKESSGPYVNISAVARRYGLKPTLLYRWRREFGVEEQSAPSEPNELQRPRESSVSGRKSSGSDALIEIMLANGRSVRVPADLDPAKLKMLVATLET